MNAHNDRREDTMPLSPEEIKAIGEIELGPSKHEIFLNNHYKKLLWGGIALGLIGGSAIAWFSLQQDRKNAAAAEIIAAQSSPAATESYNSAKLESITQQYGNTPSAKTAELMAGLNLLWGEHPEQGASYLQERILPHSENPLILSRAHAALATYYQENGNLPQARQHWTELTRLPANPYSALAYISLGDLAQEEGNHEEARSLYNQAAAACQTSTLVTDKIVSARLLLLDVDDPRPIAPEPTPQSTPSSLFNLDTLPSSSQESSTPFDSSSPF